MLKIENLHVEVEGKEILKGVSLAIPEGETHIVFGPNGSGKSTLMMAIMGFPIYKVTKGKIIFKGQDVTNLPINCRAKLGMGTSFQNPPTVKGVKLNDLLKKIAREDSVYQDYQERLNTNRFLERDLNAGLSGGERKRSELLQILSQSPQFIMLDEPESGVDIENMQIIGEISREFIEGTKINDRTRSALIITHTGYILDYLHGDKGHIILDGKIQCSGNPHQIFDEIQRSGFKGCELCQIT